MTDLPALIVDGDEYDWLPYGYGFDQLPEEHTVRIDGPLPTVYLSDKQGPTRPLRVGDRVTLATECQDCDDGKAYGPEWEDWDRQTLGPCETCGGSGGHPFATATVASLSLNGQLGKVDEHWIVTVTDVQPLESQ